MLTMYDVRDGVLTARNGACSLAEETVWVDLLNPTKEEDLAVETAFGLVIPTREEMAEIEASSRLYLEGGAHFMTAICLHQPDGGTSRDPPIATPVTFILAGNRLVTVRYVEPRAFAMFQARAQKKDAACGSGLAILVGLLEAIIDREADRVERIQGEVDRLAQGIFEVRGGEKTRTRRFDVLIKTIGREGELTSRSREGLLTLDRLLTYLAHVMSERKDDKVLRQRIKTAGRDIHSLSDHIGYLSDKITFLLDATLGMINNEQNTIIKIMSLASVVFLPPTLVASVYGMNFKGWFPELEWAWGYPFALVLMVATGVLPYFYFKRKGWL